MEVIVLAVVVIFVIGIVPRGKRASKLAKTVDKLNKEDRG